MIYNRYIQRLILFSKNKDFQKDIKILRNEFNLPLPYSKVKNDFSIVSKWNIVQFRERAKKGLPFDLFEKTDSVRDKYNFPLLFRWDFICYVMYGIKAVLDNAQPDDNWPKVLIETNYKNKIPEIRLRIFGDTTLDDLRKVWKAVKAIQKGKGIVPSVPLPEAKHTHLLSAKELEEAELILGARVDESYDVAEQIWNIDPTNTKASQAKLKHLNVKRHRLRKKIHQ